MRSIRALSLGGFFAESSDLAGKPIEQSKLALISITE